MSTQPGLMCLDKAVHMTDRCRETSVLITLGACTVGARQSPGLIFFPLCGFCLPLLKLFYLDSFWSGLQSMQPAFSFCKTSFTQKKPAETLPAEPSSEPRVHVTAAAGALSTSLEGHVY